MVDCTWPYSESWMGARLAALKLCAKADVCCACRQLQPRLLAQQLPSRPAGGRLPPRPAPLERLPLMDLPLQPYVLRPHAAPACDHRLVAVAVECTHLHASAGCALTRATRTVCWVCRRSVCLKTKLCVEWMSRRLSQLCGAHPSAVWVCCVQSLGSDEQGRNGKAAVVPAVPTLAPLVTRGTSAAAASQVAPSPVAPSGINNSWVLPANGTGTS